MSHRILIVDDEHTIRLLLRRAFERESWKVTTCATGTEAIARCQRSVFDLAVIDVYMDPVDGVRVLREFKKRRPRSPVMMVTGRGSIDIAVEVMKSGADEFISKPFQLDDLVSRVSGLIEAHRPFPHPLARRMDRYLEAHHGQADLTLRCLTEAFGISERYACRLFREQLKTTFRQRLRHYRLTHARQLLRSTRLPIGQIAAACGFSHQKRLSEAFHRAEGITPRQYRQAPPETKPS